MKAVLVDKETITFPKVKKLQKSNKGVDLKTYDGPTKKRVKSKRTPGIPTLRIFKKEASAVLKPLPRIKQNRMVPEARVNVFPPLPAARRRVAVIDPPAFAPVAIDLGLARRELPENMRLGPPPPLVIEAPAMINVPALAPGLPLNFPTLNM